MIDSITEDKFLGGQLQIQQPSTGFRSGSDAVLLAAAVRGAPGQKILEVGCGAGVASLCLAHRLPEVRVTGIDVQGDLISLAKENAYQNNLSDRIKFVQQDIEASLEGLKPQSFDQVFSNPPYYGGYSRATDEVRALARQGSVLFKDWVTFCLKMLKPRGRLTLIYPAGQLQRLVQALGPSVGEMEVFPLWPREGVCMPKRLILKVRKGVSGTTFFYRGLALHGDGSAYTPQAHDVLWNGTSLF